MSIQINSLNTPDELLQAYTSLFLFLGGAVSLEPVESGLPHLCDSGLLRNLPVSSRNRTYNEATLRLKSPCIHKTTCNETISANYSQLMCSDSNASAYPAASLWSETGNDGELRRRRLDSLYGKYGYSVERNCGLEADHLGIELLFLNLLIEKFLTENDSVARESVRTDAELFISAEMLEWLPRWAAAISENSVTKCYTGISGLIIGSLEDVHELLAGQKLGL